MLKSICIDWLSNTSDVITHYLNQRLSAPTAQILKQITLTTPTQKPVFLFRVYVSDLSQYVSSQLLVRNTTTGNTQKKISLCTHIKSWNYDLTVSSVIFVPVALCHVGHVCACVHMCTGKRTCESRWTGTCTFCHKYATNSREKVIRQFCSTLSFEQGLFIHGHQRAEIHTQESYANKPSLESHLLLVAENVQVK